MTAVKVDLSQLDDPGCRRPLLVRRGAVATSQPLAAAVGLRVLQDGGSAVDAAIATAACLTVVEPCSTGLGSDAFALVWDNGVLHGLNGSGRSPAALSAEALRGRGLRSVPYRGWEAVTVPGAVQAWADLHARFGRLDFADLLEPAAQYADEGFLVSPVVAAAWQRSADEVQPGLRDAAHAEWGHSFTISGRSPRAGELWRQPEQAVTLRALAASGGRDLYGGRLAAQLVRHAEATGGYLTLDDLARHRSTWVAPISASYRGHQVWELPPNGQGIAALMALGILDGADLAPDPQNVDWWHTQIEAMKLALTDTHAFGADPEMAEVPVAAMLSAENLARLRALIRPRARQPVPGEPSGSHTVLLVTADNDGQLVSFIQSNYDGFGSHIVVPNTGIALQNRGAGFSLQSGHPNELAARKRPFHTIIPAFLTRDGEPIGPFGVTGAHMQPQGHVQVISHTLDQGDDPQTALGRARWFWRQGREVLLEPTVPQYIADGLAARGHHVGSGDRSWEFGRGQAIWRLDDGYVVGSEPRADSHAMGW